MIKHIIAMKTKYYLIFLALLLSFNFNNKVLAQKCLAFKYDADGNRINRVMKLACMEIRDSGEEQETEPPYDEVKVYPNPTNGNLRVIMPERVKQETSFFDLYDVNGLLVFSGIIKDVETVIDIGNCQTGVYLLRIRNGDDVITEIVVKQ